MHNITNVSDLISFQHFGFFVLRRPLLSATKLTEFHERLSFSNLEHELKQVYSNKLLQEGVCLASAELHKKLLRWLNGEKLSGHDELVHAFYKYFVRASTRCTPFGLFAGITYGEICENTLFEFKSDAPPLLNITPDFKWQCKVASMLFDEILIRSNLKVKPNSSLVRVGDTYRYIERAGNDYVLSCFDCNDTLQSILDQATAEISFMELTDNLVDLGYTSKEATSFINELLANDLLEFAEGPTVIGNMFPGQIIEKLSTIPTFRKRIDELIEIQEYCETYNSDLTRLHVLQNRMTEFDGNNDASSKVKVDSFFEFRNAKLSEHFVHSVVNSLSELSVLDFSLEDPELMSFKQAFHSLYDSQEVPLGIVMDTQLGIGFKGDLSYLDALNEEALNFRASENHKIVENANTWWQDYLVSKHLKFLAGGIKEISLSIADLHEVASHRPKNFSAVATSAFAFGSVYENNGSGYGSEDFNFILLACQGPSAINMLGRFAEGCSKLKSQLSKIVEYEQHKSPDVIFAEVVHSPATKVGNVMTRPTLYDYEIEYLGNSSLPRANVINISDLMVSIRDGHIVLRSKRLNKRIIPRLSNMHNHRQGLPVYRFLAALQSQDSSLNIGWNWGHLANSDFLPRVRYKNIVISRASWKIRKSDFKTVSHDTVSGHLTALGVPRHFFVAVGDNELFVDTGVAQSFDLFIRHISKNDISIVKESILTSAKSILIDSTESFSNEVVIPLMIKQGFEVQSLMALTRSTASHIIDQFEPGSEWVYFKIYGNETMLDLLIREKISHFAEQLIEDRIVKKFFFVRYKDTDSHLRLRFLRHVNARFEDIVARVRVLLAFEFKNMLISKIQIDTYKRELDRYGEDKIELCETYFSHNSILIGRFLRSGLQVKSVYERLNYTIQEVMKVFAKTGVKSPELTSLCINVRDNLLSKQGFPTSELKSWHLLTRQIVQKDFPGISEETLNGYPYTPTLVEIFIGLKDIERQQMAISLVHMSVNRIFKENHRYYESVVFHVISKILLRQKLQIGTVEHNAEI